MRVLVLGSGVIGTTSAWYLRQAGFEVTVIDRQPGPALETSFANAGQLSFGYTSPWAAPGVPKKAIGWLFEKHAPLAIKPGMDLAQYRWLWQMLRNCTHERYAINKARMVRMSEYSRDCLNELRAQIGYVEQDAPVLAGTLRDNLLLGSPVASDAECEHVLRAVNLGAVLDRDPAGLGAAVGDDGIMLSGGERQRLAIAPGIVERDVGGIDAQPGRSTPFVECGEQQRAGTRAEVENAPRRTPGEMRHRRLDQRLAIGARHQHARPHRQLDRPEGTTAGNIGDRLMREPPREQRAKAVRRWGVEPLQQQRFARDAEGVCHQQLGIEPRRFADVGKDG